MAKAQESPLVLSGKDRYKQASGRYGGNEGLCLFEDGTYLLYGYATAVFGTYSFEKDYLLFAPDKTELFEVYATQNKSIGTQAKINYIGFEGNGRCFLQLDKGAVRQVFNDDANCFDAPFVAAEKQSPASFVLSAALSDHRPPVAANVYAYENTGLYNDFIFLYHAPRREYAPFSASLYQSGPGEILIKLSNYGGDKGYRKQNADEDEQKQWQEVLDMKEEYRVSKSAMENGILANEHYNIFMPDLKTYNFDKAQNLYTSKTAKDNEAYFQQNPYHDDRYLHRYVKLLPKTKSKDTAVKAGKESKSIFFTLCEDDLSYRYEGLEEHTESATEMPLLEPVPPVPAVETNDQK